MTPTKTTYVNFAYTMEELRDLVVADLARQGHAVPDHASLCYESGTIAREPRAHLSWTEKVN